MHTLKSFYWVVRKTKWSWIITDFLIKNHSIICLLFLFCHHVLVLLSKFFHMWSIKSKRLYIIHPALFLIWICIHLNNNPDPWLHYDRVLDPALSIRWIWIPAQPKYRLGSGIHLNRVRTKALFLKGIQNWAFTMDGIQIEASTRTWVQAPTRIRIQDPTRIRDPEQSSNQYPDSDSN